MSVTNVKSVKKSSRLRYLWRKMMDKNVSYAWRKSVSRYASLINDVEVSQYFERVTFLAIVYHDTSASVFHDAYLKTGY